MEIKEFPKLVEFTLTNQVYKRENSFRENINIQKRKMLDMKVNELIYNMKQAIKYLNKADLQYKELINKTEYFERQLHYKFDFKCWNQLRKVRGHFIRYLNDLYVIKAVLEKEKEENKWQ